jgi:hypothetical protein
MLNWVLREFSSTDVARVIRPFEAIEVAAARERPRIDARARRAALSTSDH